MLPFAIETTKPPAPNQASSSSRPYVRWEPLESEIWLGGLEKYNPRLEGYEAIVALEVYVVSLTLFFQCVDSAASSISNQIHSLALLSFSVPTGPSCFLSPLR